MEEVTSMSDILSDAPPPEAPAQAEGAPPAEAPSERYSSRKKEHQEKEFAAQGLERDQNGQWKKREATPAEAPPVAPAAPVAAPAAQTPPQQEMSPKEKALLAAATDERNKRQALERKLAELNAKPAEQPKPFWDDPDGAIKASEERMQQAIMSTKLQTAEASARTRLPDFDDKIAVFREHIEAQPVAIAQSIAREWLSSPDPAQFAYNFAKSQQELKAAGDLPALRAQIEAETTAKVRAQVEAEFKAAAEKSAAERAAIPRSLSNTRAAGGASAPVWGGPPSMDDILSGKD